MKKVIISLIVALATVAGFADNPGVIPLPGTQSGSTNNPGTVPTGPATGTNRTGTIWVDALNGSDANSGVFGAPLKTLRRAKSNAVAGQLIYVLPGNYNDNNLLKRGVNWHFQNAYVWFYGTTNNPWGIFDDRTTGATTNTITGNLNFFWSAGTNDYIFGIGATNALGGVLITNANSCINLTFDTGAGECWLTEAEFSPAVLNIRNGKSNYVAFNRLVCSRRTATVGGNANTVSGIIWGAGDIYMRGNYLGAFPDQNYGIWTDGGNASANGYFSFELCEGYVYQSANTLNYKSWWDFKELRVSHPLGAANFLGGKIYLRAQKVVNASDYGLLFATGAQGWITVQKMTNDGGKGWLRNSATLFADVQHFEDASTANTPRIYNDGPLALRAGPSPTWLTNGPAYCQIAGAATVSGLHVNTQYGTNAPVVVAAPGLTLINNILAGPLTTNSITAADAQTVAVLFCAGRNTNNSNVTLSMGNTNFVVSPNLQ